MHTLHANFPLKCPSASAKSKILTSGSEINFSFDAGLSSFACTQSARALGGCFFISMHLIELNALQVMVLKRSRSPAKDDMQTFNSWCSLLNKRESQSNKIKAEYYCLASDSL